MQLSVPVRGNKGSTPLVIKTYGGSGGRRNSQLHRRVHWRDHRVLEHTQTHPSGNQHQKGPICLWVAGEVTESQLRAKQAPHFSLSDPSPHTAPQHSDVGCPTLRNTLGSAPYYDPVLPRQKNMAQIKEQIKAPKIELSNEEIASLSDAEFKTLVSIGMLTEMIEYGHKIKEEMKSLQSEIKENI